MTGAPSSAPIAVLGAGPAGLTAARELVRAGRRVVVWEADPQQIGGISRTVEREGFRFDIGGHRFFSKSELVNQMWQEILPRDFITRARLSRIYYRGRFFQYPLEAREAFFKLGPVESARVLLSYLVARLCPARPERSFEDWVSNRFGRRLFEIFFKSYTEKVWGISCGDISADWAAQRIRGLSLWEAARNALGFQRQSPAAKTLIRQFIYPRLGPGQLWEAVRDELIAAGASVELDRRVTRIRHRDGRLLGVEAVDSGGRRHACEVEHVISSLPLQTVLEGLAPAPPEEVLKAARGLRYRDFLTVCLVVRRENVFDDHWIYIHDPDVRVGRVQNYKNWSPEMVPDPSWTSLGLEYFCFENDTLWRRPDEDLGEMAVREAGQIGLVRRSEVEKTFVVRMPKAYPVYNHGYRERIETVRGWLEVHLPGLAQVGRNGQHRYNNQDHSMLTAKLAADNLLGISADDPWSVNSDAEYLEESRLSSS